MNRPRILLPLVVAGLVLTATFTTAVLVNAAECTCGKAAANIEQPATAEVNALFEIAPLTVPMRARLVLASPNALQAEVDALFDVAPLPMRKR